MNSDLIPSSQASIPSSEPTHTEASSDATKANRQQPIPPPSEPMQYHWFSSRSLPSQHRAIYSGYVASNRRHGSRSRPAGAGYQFGQESPRFSTRTFVGGLSSYGAKRRQLASPNCWSLGARKVSPTINFI